jgi:hypothetical protein
MLLIIWKEFFLWKYETKDVGKINKIIASYKLIWIISTIDMTIS